MTKEEIAEIVHGMPQGMTADDYLVELVSRAVTPLEQRIKLLRDEVAWAENGYTKHKWVGLTDKEFESILEQHNEAFPFAVYQSIEAKLKEKNT